VTLDPVSLEREESDGKLPDRPGRIQALRRDGSVARPQLRWILPLVALAVGVGLYWLFVATREMPDTRDPVIPSPLVRVMTVEPRDVRFSVESRGVVSPRTESDLVAEVRGRVLSLSPRLVVGGFFEQGDELLRLDDREHRIALDRAEATVRLRESEARLASADADRRRQLKSRGAASTADLEQFESREMVARASLAGAKAALSQAELDLERTIVRAPFDGRVRDREVDVGQFVSPGTKLGRIFAVDYAEVRLPLQTDELAYLDAKFVGLDRRERFEAGIGGSPVRLTGRLGGRELAWDARLVRAEAAIDEQTRMLNVVARVDDPYLLKLADETADGDGPPRVPLPAGLFVNADIAGRSVSGVFVIPVMALRDGDRVFVRDADDRLRVRSVSVLRRDRGEVVIDGGLAVGDQVVVSPLRIYSEGMLLRAVEADAS
jgi:multidrug efflux system membrane fusion protein